MPRASFQRFVDRLLPKKARQLRLMNLDDRGYIQNRHLCPACSVHIEADRLAADLFVCHNCDYHFRISGPERLRFLADHGRYQEFSAGIDTVNALEFPDYDEKLKEAKAKTGMEEAVTTGICSIEGRETVVVAMSFQFMGGSMGVVVGEKIARALILAASKGLPVILFAASGGARMQEGIYSLMQMAKTAHACALLERAGLPFFVVLTDPTTGGVTASFAMLGDVTLAEPEALIGFAGPRVIEGTIRQKLPEGFQRSEFQREKGFVDSVVHRKDLKKTLVFLIDAYRQVRGATR